MPGRLERKRAIISGAGAGMGRAAALRFAAEGARVGLLDIDEAAAAAVAKEVGDGGGDALVLPTDVTSEDQVAGAVVRAGDAWGGLDVVVANAGVQLAGQDDRADRLDLAVWQRTIDINLTGIFLVCKHGIRALLANGGGGGGGARPAARRVGWGPGVPRASHHDAGR